MAIPIAPSIYSNWTLAYQEFEVTLTTYEQQKRNVQTLACRQRHLTQEINRNNRKAVDLETRITAFDEAHRESWELTKVFNGYLLDGRYTYTEKRDQALRAVETATVSRDIELAEEMTLANTELATTKEALRASADKCSGLFSKSLASAWTSLANLKRTSEERLLDEVNKIRKENYTKTISQADFTLLIVSKEKGENGIKSRLVAVSKAIDEATKILVEREVWIEPEDTGDIYVFEADRPRGFYTTRQYFKHPGKELMESLEKEYKPETDLFEQNEKLNAAMDKIFPQRAAEVPSFDELRARFEQLKAKAG